MGLVVVLLIGVGALVLLRWDLLWSLQIVGNGFDKRLRILELKGENLGYMPKIHTSSILNSSNTPGEFLDHVGIRCLRFIGVLSLCSRTLLR